MSNVTNAMNIMSQNIAYIFGYNQPTVVGDVTNSNIDDVTNICDNSTSDNGISFGNVSGATFGKITSTVNCNNSYNGVAQPMKTGNSIKFGNIGNSKIG